MTIYASDKAKEHHTGTMADYISDYRNGYICDIVSEIADSNVDIYTSDLWSWAASNYEWVDEAVSDGLVDTGSFDIVGAIRAGQYLANESEIYEGMEDAVLCVIFTELWERGHETIPEDAAEEIESMTIDNNFTLDGLIEEAEDIVYQWEAYEDED